ILWSSKKSRASGRRSSREATRLDRSTSTHFTCCATRGPSTRSRFPEARSSSRRASFSISRTRRGWGGGLGTRTRPAARGRAAEHLAKQQFTTILVGAAGVAASDDRGDGQRAAAVAAMVGSLVNMRFSRKDESEADSFGVKYMSQAGYDPRAMADVMRILKEA